MTPQEAMLTNQGLGAQGQVLQALTGASIPLTMDASTVQSLTRPQMEQPTFWQNFFSKGKAQDMADAFNSNVALGDYERSQALLGQKDLAEFGAAKEKDLAAFKADLQRKQQAELAAMRFMEQNNIPPTEENFAQATRMLSESLLNQALEKSKAGTQESRVAKTRSALTADTLESPEGASGFRQSMLSGFARPGLENQQLGVDIEKDLAQKPYWGMKFIPEGEGILGMPNQPVSIFNKPTKAMTSFDPGTGLPITTPGQPAGFTTVLPNQGGIRLSSGRTVFPASSGEPMAGPSLSNQPALTNQTRPALTAPVPTGLLPQVGSALGETGKQLLGAGADQAGDLWNLYNKYVVNPMYRGLWSGNSF